MEKMCKKTRIAIGEQATCAQLITKQGKKKNSPEVVGDKTPR
jgi:hypothetical protein